MENAKNRPCPAAHSCGYTNGKLTGFYRSEILIQSELFIIQSHRNPSICLLPRNLGIYQERRLKAYDKPVGRVILWWFRKPEAVFAWGVCAEYEDSGNGKLHAFTWSYVILKLESFFSLLRQCLNMWCDYWLPIFAFVYIVLRFNWGRYFIYFHFYKGFQVDPRILFHRISDWITIVLLFSLH